MCKPHTYSEGLMSHKHGTEAVVARNSVVLRTAQLAFRSKPHAGLSDLQHATRTLYVQTGARHVIWGWLRRSENVNIISHYTPPPTTEKFVASTERRLRSLAAGVSPRKTRSIHVGFVVDKVELGQSFLRVLRFSPVNISFHRRSPNSYHPGNA
jgi:hypothetical protein